jgi:hypothetical protein
VTAAGDPPVRAPAFSPKVVLALVLVGVVSFAGLAVLSAYAPDLRADNDGGANALSSSAVGFKGAQTLLQALGTPVVVSRANPPPAGLGRSALLILTPTKDTTSTAIRAFPKTRPTLVVLPKWETTPDPTRRGFVRKAGVMTKGEYIEAIKRFVDDTVISHDPGVSRPVLHGAGAPFAAGEVLPLDAIDQLQTIRGKGWIPVLTDAQGRAVLVRSKETPHLLVLADPDLLNTQGLATLANARAAVAVVDSLRDGGGVVFDVTLNGYKRGRGLWRMMLEPPWLAATLCAVAAALLMGLHALARFGPAQARGRAFALGKRALVDNSAGLIRMAGREHELAPAYAALTRSLIGQAAGGRHAGADARWLDRLARLRQVEDPEALEAEADRARSRDDLLVVARKLYRWRLEMTRERH